VNVEEGWGDGAGDKGLEALKAFCWGTGGLLFVYGINVWALKSARKCVCSPTYGVVLKSID